jgi:hypothetical protein
MQQITQNGYMASKYWHSARKGKYHFRRGGEYGFRAKYRPLTLNELFLQNYIPVSIKPKKYIYYVSKSFLSERINKQPTEILQQWNQI